MSNQIGATPGENYGSVVNIYCKDIDYPANGECDYGWLYYNGTDWTLDPTLTTFCTGSLYH